MNINDLDLNLLRYFLMVMEEGTISRAAHRLGLTQPALSRAMARLRTAIGDPLFVRTAKGMRPTARALTLNGPVRLALGQIDLALRNAIHFDPQESKRRFRLMATDYVEWLLMPNLIQHSQKVAPHISFDLIPTEGDFFARLESGEADLLIGQFSQLPGSLKSTRLWQDEYACLAHRDNPAIHQWDLQSFANLPHVFITKLGVGGGAVDEALAQQGLKRHILAQTRHFLLPAHLVARTDAVTTLPRKIAESLAMPELTLLKPPMLLPDIRVRMIWSQTVHADPAHQWLRNQILTQKI